jgi:hypothetical protein
MENIMHSDQSFRIPGNFAEFYAQYPTFVRNFVYRYMRSSPIQERQDRESELICFLLDLPAESKFRCSGAGGRLGGCSDRIMTFDQERVHGASAGLFFGYLNRIMRNQFLNLEARRLARPLTQRGTLRIVDSDFSDDSRATTDYGICMEQVSAQQHPLSLRPSENPEESTIVSRFLDFVRKLNPELIPVLERISSCTAYAEAQVDLGLDDRLFNRARSRLKVLYACYVSGGPIPRQRRVYRIRKGRNTRLGYNRSSQAHERQDS